MSNTPPIHLIASFAEKDHFLQNYMYHVPSGGVFVDLGHGTPAPLLGMDRREMLGRIAEVRIVLAKPRVEMGFRGAITYASPFKPGINHRRLGVEFFRYEIAQKDFLLEILNSDSETPPVFRKFRRYPAHLRVQFECEPGVPLAGPPATRREHVRVVGRTGEISLSGCSFHSVRFLAPGTKVNVKLMLPESKEMPDETAPEVKPLAIQSTVRWHQADNFAHRYMGLEFDEENPKLEAFIAHLQTRIEQELIQGRRLGPTLTT